MTVAEDWGKHVTDLNQMPRIIFTDVNIEQRNVNIDNVNSRSVNISNVNCTDKSRKGQVGKSCHLERYCHVCRVAERGVNKFKMCAKLQVCLLLQEKLSIKGWK